MITKIQKFEAVRGMTDEEFEKEINQKKSIVISIKILGQMIY